MNIHLTPEALSVRWSCSKGWLANQRSAGVGPAYIKLGTKVLYALSAVEAYEQARTVTAA